MWSRRLVALLLVSIATAIPIAWVTGGYLRLPLTEMIGFWVEDGMCAAGSEPLGKHCFSDFSILTGLLAAPSFWNPDPTPYPPSGWMVPVLIYLGGTSLSGVQFATYIFLLVSLAACLTPAVWVAKGQWITRGPVSLLVIGLGAAPVLTVLDRGQSLALTVPAVLAFSIGMVKDNRSLILTGAIASTLLKPQMILLVIALIALRKYWDTVLIVIISTIGIVGSFLFWPGNRIENFRIWIYNLTGYSDYGMVYSVYPYNLSATRSILSVFDLLHLSSVVGEVNRQHLFNVLTRYSFLPGLALIVVAITILYFRRKQVDVLTILFITTSLIILVPGTSWHYYLVLFIPVAALILKDPRIPIERTSETLNGFQGSLDDETASKVQAANFRFWMILILITLSFSLWTIPLPKDALPGDFEGTLGLIPTLWGPALLFGTVAILFSLLLRGSTASQTSGETNDRESASDRGPVSH